MAGQTIASLMTDRQRTYKLLAAAYDEDTGLAVWDGNEMLLLRILSELHDTNQIDYSFHIERLRAEINTDNGDEETEFEGDCFEVAVRVAQSLRRSGLYNIVQVVHGLPVGRGPQNDGKRFWHAWVEVYQGHGRWTVVDRSNGLDLEMARRDYYLIAQIKHAHITEHTWRFQVEELDATMTHWGHYGPWVPMWKDLCDI